MPFVLSVIDIPILETARLLVIDMLALGILRSTMYCVHNTVSYLFIDQVIRKVQIFQSLSFPYEERNEFPAFGPNAFVV